MSSLIGWRSAVRCLGRLSGVALASTYTGKERGSLAERRQCGSRHQLRAGERSSRSSSRSRRLLSLSESAGITGEIRICLLARIDPAKDRITCKANTSFFRPGSKPSIHRITSNSPCGHRAVSLWGLSVIWLFQMCVRNLRVLLSK